MEREQVIFKRIVSPDGKTIAEIKSSTKVSGDGQSEIRQSLTVDDNQSQVSQSVSINISSSSGSSKSSHSGSISIKTEQ